MQVTFSDKGLSDYMEWLSSGDMKGVKRIFALINDIKKNGLLDGLGRPEKLRYRDDEYSREITKGDRLVYKPIGNGDLLILSCRGHYDDK